MELAKAPKLQRGVSQQSPISPGEIPRMAANYVGKGWNAPNTLFGLAYGGAGHVAGELNRLRSGDQPNPRIRLGHNAVEFINNPGGGVSAVTLGNATVHHDDPYAKRDPAYMAHEEAHTRQGELLGPFYLPSNILGGLSALALDRDSRGRPDWHGPHNWNERGPQGTPPRPWPPK
ncbi:hypothetical protein [Phenylobacterium sp.]|uniref:hypothetical protein n=1 Tax=Phenylobacterium sp. TaxID=1871053 RepID=UPI003925D501